MCIRDRTLDDWIGHGWNPANVQGLLEVFEKGGIEERGNGSGKREPESKAARKRKYGRHAVTVLPDGKPP